MWKKAFVQTRREQRSSLDGINLFFGALLGANLGSLNNLELAEYAGLVIMLAGAVVTLRVFTTSERRSYAFMLLGLYVLITALYLFDPPSQFDGLAAADRHRLAVTLGIWLATTVMTFYSPIREKAVEQA